MRLFSQQAPPAAKPIVIREVWGENLEGEFRLIRDAIEGFPFITMDTEFPGEVIHLGRSVSLPSWTLRNYNSLRVNVRVLKLIQLGITLTDSNGNLPDLGTDNTYIWQFNFKDFDIRSDPQNETSIALLRRHGHDFERNREMGVESNAFGELLVSSGLLCSGDVRWVTFHGKYDFGLLLKILTGNDLPEGFEEFMVLMGQIFRRFYDIKYLAKYCNGLYGGLDDLAQRFHVGPVVGMRHQAGSDSLLTWHVFQRIREEYFANVEPEQRSGVLHDLEPPSQS